MGGVEYDMIQHIATRTRDAFVFGLDFGHWFRVLMALSDILMTNPRLFYLRELIIERSVETGRLLPKSISEITVIVFFLKVFPTLVLPSLLVSPSLFLVLLCFLWKYWIFGFEFVS